MLSSIFTIAAGIVLGVIILIVLAVVVWFAWVIHENQ